MLIKAEYWVNTQIIRNRIHLTRSFLSVNASYQMIVIKHIIQIIKEFRMFPLATVLRRENEITSFHAKVKSVSSSGSFFFQSKHFYSLM
jgi:hypothetical protein